MKLTEIQIQELYEYTKTNSNLDLEREDFNIFIQKAYRDHNNSVDIYKDIKESIDRVLVKFNNEEE